MKNVLLVYLMLCLFFPIEIKAEKKPFGNGLYWELNSSGVLTIFGTGAMPDADYNGSPWSKSGPIKKVIIQHGITSIGNDSFKEDYNGNHSLLSVEIPSSVKVIGDDAFSGCKRLSSVSIPNSVTTIGEGAFFSCERLTSITIPNSVNSIGDNAFLATGLSSIVIPNSVKSIGEAAFAECINLKNISISESVISIGDDAFIGDEDDKCYEGTISLIPQWLIDKGTSEWRRCGLSAKSVEAFKRTNTPDAIIKRKGGYASVVELKNGNTKYYKVSKGGRYGLTDAEGKVIVPTEMEALESAGTGYLRYKLNGFWGVMNYAGKIIIDTDRGYTSIGDFKTINKRFPYTMTGYKGECDINGKQISKIKVETPKQNSSLSKSSSKGLTTQQNNGIYPFEYSESNSNYECKMKKDEFSSIVSSESFRININQMKNGNHYIVELYLNSLVTGSAVAKWSNVSPKTTSDGDECTISMTLSNGETLRIERCMMVDHRRKDLQDTDRIGAIAIMFFPLYAYPSDNNQSSNEREQFVINQLSKYDIKSISYIGSTFSFESAKTAATINAMLKSISDHR